LKQIKGTFEIQRSPIASDELATTIGFTSAKFEKKFKGPLSATSLVSMMGIMNKELGSGAYVALEKITGQLEGLSGSFALMHSSSMDKGKPKQLISVVPDSATDQLKGLSGNMTIDIIEGQHNYTFDYEV
jgi:Protein of unknown function (DUF3224)